MKRLALSTFALLLSGCGAVGNAVRPPALSPVVPVAETPQAPPAPVAQPTSASLFRAGSASLYADNRARAVGDILTVRIAIDDRADLANSTQRSRSADQAGGISRFFGLESLLRDLTGLDSASLAGTSSESNSSGNGTSKRSERLRLTLSASVVQRLENGNLLIRGSQESRVGHELRELIVMGIIRPVDVARDNSISHDRIAEMRLSYGGRGHLSAAQQTRWGQQILEAVMPF